MLTQPKAIGYLKFSTGMTAVAQKATGGIFDSIK